jgi:hypothetical protein
MLVIGKVVGGRIEFAYQEDQQRSGILQVKQKAN